MEVVRIAGIDPGLRFTGYAMINYDTETNQIITSNCGLVKTPVAFKGLDAVFYMMKELQDLNIRLEFNKCDHVIVEIPAAIYGAKFSAGALLPVSSIAGSCCTIFDIEKVTPVYPGVWNKRRKKEVTQKQTESILGEIDSWNYDYKPKAKSQMEHIVDAVSLALWYMQLNYIEEN
jgi:hypothetical protein